MVSTLSVITDGIANISLRKNRYVKKKRTQPSSWKRDVANYVQNAKNLTPTTIGETGRSTYGRAVGKYVEETFSYFADVVWELSPKNRKFAFPFVIRVIERAKAKRYLELRRSSSS